MERLNVIKFGIELPVFGTFLCTSKFLRRLGGTCGERFKMWLLLIHTKCIEASFGRLCWDGRLGEHEREKKKKYLRA